MFTLLGAPSLVVNGKEIGRLIFVLCSLHAVVSCGILWYFLRPVKNSIFFTRRAFTTRHYRSFYYPLVCFFTCFIINIFIITPFFYALDLFLIYIPCSHFGRVFVILLLLKEYYKNSIKIDKTIFSSLCRPSIVFHTIPYFFYFFFFFFFR